VVCFVRRGKSPVVLCQNGSAVPFKLDYGLPPRAFADGRKCFAEYVFNIESLFSIIAPYIEGSVFLDLFSGSGSISLEAISRGAKRAVMIEKDGEALKYIIENIENSFFFYFNIPKTDIGIKITARYI